jgi:hypothetical protein
MSMRNRLKAFMQASSKTVEVCPISDPTIIKVEDSRYFNIWWAMKEMPQVLIQDKVTKEVFKCKIQNVNPTDNTITLKDPLTKVLNIGSVIKRAPNYEEIRGVYLGDIDIIENYPAICVVPLNKDVDWQTLQGTQEDFNMSIIVHVKEDNQENSMISLLRIVQDVEDMLMADLHMTIQGRDYPNQYNKTYNSRVKNVEYGASAKSEMLKSAKITWFGTEFWWRIYLAQYPEVDEIFNE